MSEGLMMKYFVLKPRGDDIYAKASRAAMREYADTIIEENRPFALDIIKWLSDVEHQEAKPNGG